MKMRMFWLDRVPAATLSLAAGAAQAGWPVGNLQDSFRRKAFKTAGGGNVVIRADLGRECYINAAGLVEHNLTPATMITITAYSDAWATAIHQESHEAMGPICDWGDERWGDFDWEGYQVDEAAAAYPRMVGAYWLSAPAPARYWDIAIANGGDFYLGRLLLGEYFEPEINLSYGWEITVTDNSQADETDAGVEIMHELDERYLVEFSLHRISTQEMLGDFLRLAKHLGTKVYFILQLLNQDARQQRLATYYGRLTSNPAARGEQFGRQSAKVQFREAL